MSRVSLAGPGTAEAETLAEALALAVGNDPDSIGQLVSDVRRFADVLMNLKEALCSKDESVASVVSERLAELLRVLRLVIGKHQALNSEELLGAAGALIAKVKGLKFEEVRRENRGAVFREVHTSIDTLAFTFGNVVSDFLMGDVDGGSRVELSQNRRSRSYENLSGESEGFKNQELADPALQSPPEPSPVERVDRALLQNDSGVESALLYAKAWSKYAKDVLSWVEKRLSLDMECAKNFTKMAESAKTAAAQQDYMPFRAVYASVFEHELDHSHSLLQNAAALQTNKFIQPLVVRKNDLDKLRKDLKEQWQREQKKMSDAEGAVRKALLLHAQRKEEYERLRRGGDDQPQAGPRTLDKKRRMEEEALQKAGEALVYYKSCVADAESKRESLEKVKQETITQLRETIFQCDLTLKAVTVNWFQMLHSQLVSVPPKYQALCDQAKRYDPGQCYTEFVHSLPKDRVWLEALAREGTGLSRTGLSLYKRSQSPHSSQGNLSQISADEVDHPAHQPLSKMDEQQSGSTADLHGVKQQQGVSGMCSDSESAGGSSESRSVDSPTASPGDFKRRLPRTPSTGTMSSADDLDEREPPSLSDNGLVEMGTDITSSPGPFRNTQMSKAALTHKLRKLRSPSKCRECDSLVVFHGAECEECSLACHKKCLETLAIQCGHRKLQGRLHLFGVEFAQVARSSSDGVPFIIKKCTSEIESRAISIKGIYRINGAKSRVEKLCQAFENGKDLVELSDLHPHDISNVLKLYLRQLPEPLILYRFYNDFIGLAKEAQSIRAEDSDSPQISIELNRILFKIKDLLRQLPPAHYHTLHFLITHLHRVTEHAEENKMTAGNLGIIFGPTLIKPRQAEADVSLSSLVDYPYQALMVELFIQHHQTIFHPPSSPAPSSKPPLSRHSQSLLDIKERSKPHKRYSYVIPSSLSVDEGKEGHMGSEHEVKQDAAAQFDTPDGFNGVGSPTRRSTDPNPLLVKLRPQRTHFLSRPISLPVERLLAEHGEREPAEREASGPIAESPESESAEGRGYRSPFVHTHTLRRTWDRQYRHYDVTPRTAMIVANLPSAGAGTEAPPTPSGVSALSQNTVTVRPFRAVRRDSSTSDRDVPVAFRAPRTLHPPPGTFYRPAHIRIQSETEKSPGLSSPTTAPLATLSNTDATPALPTGSDTYRSEGGALGSWSKEQSPTELRPRSEGRRDSQRSHTLREGHYV